MLVHILYITLRKKCASARGASASFRESLRLFAAHMFGSGQARFRGKSVHGGFRTASARAFVMLEVGAAEMEARRRSRINEQAAKGGRGFTQPSALEL